MSFHLSEVASSNRTLDAADPYPVPRRQAWFAFWMTFLLMLFDFVDRQVIVAMFPHLKEEWLLSDKQLGALVSVVSLTVGLGAFPFALLADRWSRVKSIAMMATVWSLATISCAFARNYSQLFIARTAIGVGEAGYGAAGGALLATLFPYRMRGTILAAFLAAGPLGSVVGVVLGGVIATHWGWRAAFGIVGIPGLVLALLYLFVRDYKTVPFTPDDAGQTTQTRPGRLGIRSLARALFSARSAVAAYVGSGMQLFVLSTMFAWLPSFLNRVHGIAPDKAGAKAALVVLIASVGSVAWGLLADRLSKRSPRNKLRVPAFGALLTFVLLGAAFGALPAGGAQFALIAAGGFVMTCSVGPVGAVAMDVVHPGLRATAASVVALAQNLLGLAAGPFITGVLSDAYGLQAALAIVPVFSLLACVTFLYGSRSYEADLRRAGSTPSNTDSARLAAHA